MPANSNAEWTAQDVEAAFPYLELDLWQGVCGTYFARKKGSSGPVLAEGDDWHDLAQRIFSAVSEKVLDLTIAEAKAGCDPLKWAAGIAASEGAGTAAWAAKHPDSLPEASSAQAMTRP